MNILAQLMADWNDLAEIDPMWAICADPRKAHGRWNTEEFFETGRIRIHQFLNIIRDSDQTFNKHGTALDFGCGIGRLTQALAEHIDTCYGVDISSRMITLAKKYNRYSDRCIYINNSRSNLEIFESDYFDLIISDLVLQHMPTDLMESYIRDFIRTLKPKGVLVFQVPIERLLIDTRAKYLRSLPRFHYHRLLNKFIGIVVGHDITGRYYRLRMLGFSKKWLYKNLGFRPEVQMHTIAESKISELMVSLGAEVVRISKHTDVEMLDAIFVVVKS